MIFRPCYRSVTRKTVPFHVKEDDVTAQLIDGKSLAKDIRDGIGLDVKALEAQTGVRPGLAVVLVGDDPASAVYVRNKKKACDTAGLYVADHHLSAETSQAELLTLVDRLNADPKVHGILVQLPLPAHIDGQAVLNALVPDKDVDGFHPYNIGRLVAGDPVFVPCTPKGVIRMIESTGEPLPGSRPSWSGAATSWKARCHAPAASTRHRDGVSFPDKGPPCRLPGSRYSGCRDRQTPVHQGRYGERRGHRDRRGHQSTR